MSSTQQLLLTEGGGGIPNYIEDVFSTYLYTGTGAAQTITNNIDLSTKGGMVWLKVRSGTTGDHEVFDTLRGATKRLIPNATNAQITNANTLTAFNADGFSIGNYSEINGSGNGMASWTFRKQPKFFDVVTYTGDGSAPRAISHSLGSTPGCIMIKKTSATGDWLVFHRSAPNQGAAYPNIGGNLYLNYTDAADSGTNPFLSAVSSTTFTLSTNQNTVMNASGATYVAYIFAHDAGGFGLTGTDNVISCGSFTTDGSGAATVSLGYEPQYFLFKRTDSTGNWRVLDVMRGGSLTQSSPLVPNTSDAENSFGSFWSPTSTGFNIINQAASSSWIYIAIRRGPMKVPTDATKVFAPVAYAGNDTANRVLASGITEDLSIIQPKDGGAYGFGWVDRLRGNPYVISSSTGAETSSIGRYDTNVFSNGQTGVTVQTNGAVNSSAFNYIHYGLRRAPSFFDEVCYTGTGAAQNLTHNLGAAPELIITKTRSTTANWNVYHSAVGATKAMVLNTTAAPTTATSFWNDTAPTSSVFTVGTANGTNNSGSTYVAYLFATCAGVSKVGSYTGNGSTQAIACGFAGGARFVLIKRTDSTGDWYVYDTARGMTTLTDPYLLLNSTAAESATLGSVTTTTGGFTVNAAILAAINTNAASYVFLAIA